MMHYKNIAALKEKIFEQSNTHCFIERDRFLASLPAEDDRYPGRYAKILSGMLDAMSTPIDENDVFAGRVVEAQDESEELTQSRTLLYSKGHIIPDYPHLLEVGYKGILEEIRQSAKKHGTEQAQLYLKNAETVILAVRRYALRYSAEAEKCGKARAAEALARVPYEPAYDLYSALQGIWLMHMIAGCYVGSRDYAFGYMDEYLYPYYLREKELGTTDDEIRAMLSGFFIKTNEICGRATHNYKKKPILSNASKQYVLLGGVRSNELSHLILDAAKYNCMAQPIFTVMLSRNTEPAFKSAVFDAMSVLTDKLQVYNYDSMKHFLESKGLPEEITTRPSVSACCTFDISAYACREEFYLPTVQIFCKTLFENEFSSKEEMLLAYKNAIRDECQRYLDETRSSNKDSESKKYVLDCLLLRGCTESCEYPPEGLKYRAKNVFLPGIATLGDSLAVLDTLVFSGDVPYNEFIRAEKENFEGYDELYEKIASCPRFGNDTDIDRYTVEMANALIDAVEGASHTENEIVAPSFYSLERDNLWASATPATPDGRRAGTPFSENQSPVYGADKNGITALLCSLSKLPFERTAAGGLNLTFSKNTSPDILKSLIETYFSMGGLHIGITVLDRSVLKDAMVHPEKYRSLTVRLYGFSEYFISLPVWQQNAILNRTEY